MESEPKTQIGFCSKCNIVRQDDAYGPVTPCACFVDHHAADCRLRLSTRSWIGISCEEHGRESVVLLVHVRRRA